VQAVNYNSDRTVNTNPFGEVSSQKGCESNEVYACLNYVFHGHKLRPQTGWSDSRMDDSVSNGGDYTDWDWTSGLRVS
jgi:hypothetical protein